MSDEAVEVLLVEDNPNDAELVMRVLKKHNLANKLVLLKDGAEALDFLFCRGEHAEKTVNHTPKVILLDLKLPKVDGLEVLREIKSDERMRNIPVVILTASAEERDLKEAYDLGANSYVTKPIQFSEFADVVSQLGLYWLVVNRPPVK